MDIDIPQIIHNNESASTSTNLISQVSHLTNEEPSHSIKETGGEGGGR